MAWKRKSTSQSVSVDAEVDLADFSEAQLLQALIDAKWISEAEADAIQKRASTTEKSSIIQSTGFDADYLDNARRAAMRGEKSEALHYIEHFLGREWIGRLG